jgi:hypothetical protein
VPPPKKDIRNGVRLMIIAPVLAGLSSPHTLAY